MYAEHRRRRARRLILGGSMLALMLGMALVPLVGYPLHALMHGLPAAHFYRECVAPLDVAASLSPACRPGLSYAWLRNSARFYASLYSHWPLWKAVLLDTLWQDGPVASAI